MYPNEERSQADGCPAETTPPHEQPPSHQPQETTATTQINMNNRNITDGASSPSHMELPNYREKKVAFSVTNVSWPWMLVMICISFTYLIAGGAVIYVIESNAAQRSLAKEPLQPYTQSFLDAHPDINASELFLLIEVITKALDNGSLVMPNYGPTWTFDTALFFACTVITTIGYGNLAPVTAEGQVFIVVFALFGIPLNLVIVASLGKKLNISFRNLVHRMFDFCGHPNVRSRHKKIVAQLFIWLIGVVALIVVPTFIFVRLEGWSYPQAIYFSVITLTTIGFGDLVSGFSDSIGAEWLVIYRICLTLWLIMGLTWLSTMFNSQKEVCTFCFHKSVETQRRWSQRNRSMQNQSGTPSDGGVPPTLPPQTPYLRSKPFSNLASNSRTHILQMAEQEEDEVGGEQAKQTKNRGCDNTNTPVVGYINGAIDIDASDVEIRTVDGPEPGVN